MITILTGTNRADSYTQKIAAQYLDILPKHTDMQIQYLGLDQIPLSSYENISYDESGQDDYLRSIQDTYIVPAEKMLFIIPEYNGGFPGVLKLFIDAISIRKYSESFRGKKACLTGVSSGRAGNLRGMEHFTGILNYLQVVVYPDRLPISRIESIVDDRGRLSNDETLKAIESQVRGFLAF